MVMRSRHPSITCRRFRTEDWLQSHCLVQAVGVGVCERACVCVSEILANLLWNTRGIFYYYSNGNLFVHWVDFLLFFPFLSDVFVPEK